MSLETPETDIDRRGEKADGISLTYGKLHRVTQADQCVSQPPLPVRLSPGGLLKLLHLFLGLGMRKAGVHPKTLTGVCACERRRGSSGRLAKRVLIWMSEGQRVKISAAAATAAAACSSCDFRGNV